MTAKREETMLVSAYGLFFRETQAAIKNQHKGASFSEISNMVATMWDGLDPEHKNVYKKKAESSKKEYINALTAYRTSLKSNRTVLLEDRDQNTSPSTAVSSIVLHTQCNSVVNNMSDNKHHLSTQPLTGLPQNHFNREQVSVKPLQVLSVVPVQVIPSSISAPPVVATNSLVKQQEPLANAEKKQPPNKVCIRQGCSNMAVSNPEWENEYCSCDCVLNHCREVYNAWVTLQRNLRQHK